MQSFPVARPPNKVSHWEQKTSASHGNSLLPIVPIVRTQYSWDKHPLCQLHPQPSPVSCSSKCPKSHHFEEMEATWDQLLTISFCHLISLVWIQAQLRLTQNAQQADPPRGCHNAPDQKLCRQSCHLSKHKNHRRLLIPPWTLWGSCRPRPMHSLQTPGDSHYPLSRRLKTDTYPHHGPQYAQTHPHTLQMHSAVTWTAMTRHGLWDNPCKNTCSINGSCYYPFLASGSIGRHISWPAQGTNNPTRN